MAKTLDKQIKSIDVNSRIGSTAPTHLFSVALSSVGPIVPFHDWSYLISHWIRFTGCLIRSMFRKFKALHAIPESLDHFFSGRNRFCLNKLCSRSLTSNFSFKFDCVITSWSLNVVFWHVEFPWVLDIAVLYPQITLIKWPVVQRKALLTWA